MWCDIVKGALYTSVDWYFAFDLIVIIYVGKLHFVVIFIIILNFHSTILREIYGNINLIYPKEVN